MHRLVRVVVVAGAVAGAAGCTNVRLSQRDGCWVRETHHVGHGTQEEIGPCTKPPPKWSEDRFTRIVQECVAQADYRWQARALAAWSRHEPLPPQDARESIMTTCLAEAAASDVRQNELLRQRLAELTGERDALRGEFSRGHEQLRASLEKAVDYLGEAAKRPPPTATATATSTSDGTATSDTGLQADTGLAADTAASGVLPGGTVLATAPASTTATPAPAPTSTTTEAPTTTAPTTSTTAATPTTTATPTAGGSGTDARERVAQRLAASRAARKARPARAAHAAGCEVPPAARAGVTAAPPAPALGAP